MTKGLKYGALSIIASALLSTSAFAIQDTDYAGKAIGTLTDTTGWTIASELTTASTTVTPLNLGVYNPNDIKLEVLSNPTFNIAVKHGKITFAATSGTESYFYYIVEAPIDVDGHLAAFTGSEHVVAKMTAGGNGTSSVTFSATGPQVSNDKNYVIVRAAALTVNASDADIALTGATTLNDFASTSNVTITSTGAGITYVSDSGASSDTITVNLGRGDSQEVSDVAVAPILSTQKQVCAGIGQVSSSIDPDTEFKAFSLNAAFCGANTTNKTDTLPIVFRVTQLDDDAVSVGNADIATVTLTTNVALPANTSAKIFGSYNGAHVTVDNVNTLVDHDASSFDVTTPKTCTVTTANNASTVVCTLPVDLLTQLTGVNKEANTFGAEIDLTVDGQHEISRTQFTGQVELNFSKGTALDYASANPLVSSANIGNAGEWKYAGTTAVIPSINSNSDTVTYVRLNNDSTKDARVFWTLTDVNGVVAKNIEVASASGATGLAATKAGTWTAEALRVAAATHGVTLGEQFRAEAVVTTDNGVTGMTTMMIGGARDRVVPMNIAD
ncbi:hypothetical protein [Sulfuricurvum sp.]|uniref:hypothetical protein n=1 Tax=Sulfuricurvum sp. TaxID=2025608 RepID=UPI00260AB40F|nr:hypothetical protein [Sulfuricurvum sp.]MDD4883467.1 hypothetical protein [Sulfuricurvum sp.]